MARYLLVALSVAIICVMQTYSAPTEEPSALNPIAKIIKNPQEISKLFDPENFAGLNESVNNFTKWFNETTVSYQPGFDQLLAKTKEFFDQLPVMIPKTDEAKTTPNAGDAPST